MKKSLDLCGYVGCENLAEWRSPLETRCSIHSGHHDFTERRIEGQWQTDTTSWGYLSDRPYLPGIDTAPSLCLDCGKVVDEYDLACSACLEAF